MIKGLGERMIRAARLDGSLYEEIKTDRQAPAQAAIVVVLSAVAAGVGVFVYGGIGDFFLESMRAMTQWYLSAFFTCVVGTRLLQEPQTKTDCGTAVRMISFACAPGVIRLLGGIPGLNSIPLIPSIFLSPGMISLLGGIPELGGFVVGLASVWMLGATVVAVRKALDYTTTTRAVGACVFGWVAQWLFMGILLSLRGPAPGA